jgi:hypothetical protein
MKTLFILIAGLLCCRLQVMAQSHTKNNFKQLPPIYHQRDSLIRYVTPDKNYTYWEYVEGGMDTTKEGYVIFSKGKRPDSVKFKDPRGSLFIGCLPAFCYKYIAYIYNGKVGYITSNAEFVKFMGSIDNLEEAVLLAEITKNVYPDELKKGGAFMKTANGYELILTEYILCPQTKEAVHLVIKHDGSVQQKKKWIYEKDEGCAVI